ncbi:hypothetical protein PP182_09750 [Maribacter sp. PR1]|uniref:Lipocalin-like domain-containing protein n=1 Tax=Maribacter cobaltidurans TaxID=1178778 RepID=A0ABU7ITR2_9FLAO|nr:MULTISPECIES: hypothetical protein [Maribacter]MDC6388964.1 hypothetical protein [Maribacter sp. PR1]MEE1976352.1 hypothetical protein [Maribacter cobaltidurans]
MLKRANLLLPLILLILLACNNDDQGSQQVNLLFTEDNLIGDWKRIAEFRGQPNDSLGILEPTEDLFTQFENCRKDDMIRYVKAIQQEENTYFWGIGEVACHNQIPNSFIEIGTWTIQESGKLNRFYSDISEPFVVVLLTSQQLRIRKESGVKESEGTIYEFTEYERVR